jgi:hypothetical protein
MTAAMRMVAALGAALVLCLSQAQGGAASETS